MKAFTPAQAREFLEEVKGHRLEALFSVALSLGLRQGEVLGLRWQDVDLEKRTLAVRFQLQRINSNLQLVEPKTARSARTLMLPALAVSALAAHRQKQDDERLVAGSRWIETGMPFTTSIGTMLDARGLLKAFYQIMAVSELPRVRFHDLLTQGAIRAWSWACWDTRRSRSRSTPTPT